MADRTQAEVEEERDALTTAMKDAIPIAWEPTGDNGYRSCGGPDGFTGLSHTRQTIGPPVEDREASARVAYALIEDQGYPVDLDYRDNEKPPAWVVESQDDAWYFAIDFRDVGTVITADTRCFPWDQDVDGPPLKHTRTPTPTPTPETPVPPTPSAG